MIRVLLAMNLVCLTVGDVLAEDWSRFRGPNGQGRVEKANIPLEWSAEKNLKWKTPLPGKGSSSPVVAGDRVYLTSYTGYGLDPSDPGDASQLVRHLIAIDRTTGEEVWRESVASTSDDEDPYRGFITQHGYASASPVTDGERVYALLGKSGLFAFDRDGNKLWQIDLGQKSDPARWGDGSSPILVGDLVVVDAGVLGNKFVAVNKLTGDEAWSVENESFTNCWSTPTVVNVDGRDQILFQVPKRVIAIDPATGDDIWSVETPLDDAACGGIVLQGDNGFLMGSREGNGMGFKCGGSGNVSDTNTLWQTRLRSGICTPVIVGDHMYWSTGGIFYAADLKTGESVYKERLPRLGRPTGGFPNADYASPIAVGDLIIQFTRSGESYVIKATDSFELVAHNPAFTDDDSAFSASPAISNDELFVRSESFLYCIGKD